MPNQKNGQNKQFVNKVLQIINKHMKNYFDYTTKEMPFMAKQLKEVKKRER